MDGSLPAAFASTESSTLGGMAQRMKCLLCKDVDPSFSLQHPYKKQGLVAGTCNPSAGEATETTGSPRGPGSWQVSLAARMISKFNKSICFKKIREELWRRMPDADFGPSHAHMWVSTPKHPYTHSYVFSPQYCRKSLRGRQAGNSTRVFIIFSCLRISYMHRMPFDQIHSACKPSTSSLISSHLHFRHGEMK